MSDQRSAVVLPSRRRGRGRAVLLAILIVLALIAVIGDRAAARYATDELRAQLVAELDSRGVAYQSTDVTIGGFPFLTQVARGRYDEIKIHMTEVRLAAGEGRVATLPTLDVLATGVSADTQEVLRGTARVIADQVSGTAVVSFTTLETLVDYSRYGLSEVSFADAEGGLGINATARVGTAQVPISATAEVSVTDGELNVKLRDARAVGLAAPAPVRDYLSDLVQRTLAARLPQLPFSLSLDQVEVVADGIAVTASGRDVPLVS